MVMNSRTLDCSVCFAAAALCILCNVSSNTVCSADFLCRLFHRLLHVRLDPCLLSAVHPAAEHRDVRINCFLVCSPSCIQRRRLLHVRLDLWALSFLCNVSSNTV